MVPAFVPDCINRKKVFIWSGLIILTVIFLLSCASKPSVAILPEQQVQAEGPFNLVPYWQPFTEEAKGALLWYTAKIAKPRLELWAVRVDLSSPHIQIVSAAGSKNTRGSNASLSTKVSSFVRDNNLFVGINALPFEPTSDKENEYRRNVGIVISDGYILAPPHPAYDALVFYDNSSASIDKGRAAIISQSQIISAVNIDHAVGGFRQILINGELSPHTLTDESRHPRSAAGISSDGKYLYLMVVDGRRIGSIGCTQAETAQILKQLGAWNAINFDGGGSSSLVLRMDGRVRPVNTPIHNNIPGLERAVAGCLGIKLIP